MSQEPDDALVIIRWQSEKDKLPQWVFWLAVVVLFGAVHCRYEALVGLAKLFVARLPPPPLATSKPAEEVLEKYVTNLACIKGFLFYVAAGVLSVPIVGSIWRCRSSFRKYPLAILAKRSLLLMVVLAVLIVPVQVPWLVRGTGQGYALMSMSPFSDRHGWTYRRLLAPALASLLQMKGFPLYYVFSMGCTFVLVFLTLLFIEIRTRGGPADADSLPAPRLSLLGGGSLWILSVATSAFIIYDFQYPGYPDHLFYILILLAACVPMTTAALLGVTALSLATHDASLFALLPLVLLAFPKGARLKALCVVAIYYLLWIASFGFHLGGALAVQSVVRNETDIPPLRYLADHPMRGVWGPFLAYKLWWVLVAVAAWMLYREGKTRTVRLMLVAVLVPLAVIPIALDVSRLISMGFLGVLLAACYLIRRYGQSPRPRWLKALLVLNIVVPSIYCGLDKLFLPWGVYKLVVDLVGALWRLV